MEYSARIFNCVRCHRQVIICSCCDRGNIYCGPLCSQTSRRESIRASGKRYQNTFRGKMKHAERQKRYKKQLQNKVTHHGYQEIPTNDLLQPEINEDIKTISSGAIHCHFCSRSCSLLLRTLFLDRGRTSIPGVWPLGP